MSGNTMSASWGGIANRSKNRIQNLWMKLVQTDSDSILQWSLWVECMTQDQSSHHQDPHQTTSKDKLRYKKNTGKQIWRNSESLLRNARPSLGTFGSFSSHATVTWHSQFLSQDHEPIDYDPQKSMNQACLWFHRNRRARRNHAIDEGISMQTGMPGHEGRFLNHTSMRWNKRISQMNAQASTSGIRNHYYLVLRHRLVKRPHPAPPENQDPVGHQWYPCSRCSGWHPIKCKGTTKGIN